MAFYREQVVPRLVALTCGAKALSGLRARTAEGLTGRVVEIGFGSGYNVPHYPADVTRVLAVEPSDTALRMAGRRIGASAVPVEHQTIPQTVLRCRCSGNMGAGGTTRKPKKPPMYSGAF